MSFSISISGHAATQDVEEELREAIREVLLEVNDENPGTVASASFSGMSGQHNLVEAKPELPEPDDVPTTGAPEDAG